MSFRRVGIAALLLSAGLPCAARAGGLGYWFQPTPAVPAEQALRAVLESPDAEDPDRAAAALTAVAEAHPGTVAAGLARLEAGWELVEAGEPDQALPLLTHPEVQRTSLPDYALFAIGRALEARKAWSEAGGRYKKAADVPGTPLVCTALFRAAEVYDQAPDLDEAVASLNRALMACPGQEPRALLRLAEIQEERRDRKAAAEAYDQLDRGYPASPEARQSASRLRALERYLPGESRAARSERDFAKAQALFSARLYRDASILFERLLRSRTLDGEERDQARVLLGRALAVRRRTRSARHVLAQVSSRSSHAGEAAFRLALLERGDKEVRALEAVARRFAGGRWGEVASFDLGNHFQRDNRTEKALPYYRRFLSAYPESRYVDRATWYVGWGDYRAGRLEDAAQLLEKAARLRPGTGFTPAFLYWAGRARLELGQKDRGLKLLRDTVSRFKYSYYGSRAEEVLRGYPPAPTPPPALRPAAVNAAPEIPEPQRTRIRELLLIERLGEALGEFRGLARSPGIEATVAWIENRRGNLRAGINAMKRAYPGHVGAAGDLLPDEVWKILYPLEYEDTLRAKSRQRGLDPALVAALVNQESTFDTDAVSRAGARGLMQIMPSTGRRLARDLGVRYRRSHLHDPEKSLDFGTLYLKQMLDRFSGRVELALAAYNAGPQRVNAWTAGGAPASAEVFIESIPFTETRTYVKSILGTREQYRRIYGLNASSGNAGHDAGP